MSALLRLWKDESGQGLTEYAMLIAAVVVMVVAATNLFAGDIQDLFSSIGSYITDENAVAQSS